MSVCDRSEVSIVTIEPFLEFVLMLANSDKLFRRSNIADEINED